MDWIISFMVDKPFTALASLSSVVSLILTFFVFIGVGKIRKFYIFTARIPELSERLSEMASNISSALNGDDSESVKTKQTLAEAEVALQSLCRKSSNPIKGSAKRVIDEIREFNGQRSWFSVSNNSHGQSPEQQLRSIHIALYKLVAEIKEVYEDKRWEQ